MPNWCENAITVEGEEEHLKKFLGVLKVAEENKSLFGTFFPMPKELSEYKSPPRAESGETEEDFNKRMKLFSLKYGARDWYDWANQNWGTKWDSDDFTYSQISNTIVRVYLATAWSPPLEWVAKVSKVYPELTFASAYCEQGMQYAGVTTICDGEIISDMAYEGEWYCEDEDEDGEYEISEDMDEFLSTYDLASMGG